MVEQLPFKQRVVGSSPTRLTILYFYRRPHRLAWPRTPPFHGGDAGSNPAGDAIYFLDRFYMSVRIRLTRGGRKKKPVYRIVAIDRANRRDGKYLELLGTYDPNTAPHAVTLKKPEILKWLSTGATPSDTVKSLLQQDGLWAEFSASKLAPKAD